MQHSTALRTVQNPTILAKELVSMQGSFLHDSDINMKFDLESATGAHLEIPRETMMA